MKILCNNFTHTGQRSSFYVFFIAVFFVSSIFILLYVCILHLYSTSLLYYISVLGPITNSQA